MKYDKNSKEKLILEWKRLRSIYFNVYNENIEKFDKKHSDHQLYNSVIKNIDKSFREINQVAQNEIEVFLNKGN